MITIVTSSRYKVNKKLITKNAQEYLESYNLKHYSVNIVFVGKRKMIEIATRYKHEKVALPVLSFTYKDAPESENLLGEIFICYPQAVLLAAERGKKTDEMMRILIEHGIDNLLK